MTASTRSLTSTGSQADPPRTYCINTLPVSGYGANTSLQLPYGSTFIRCYAIDPLGLSSPACSLLVIVEDLEAPTIICPNMSINGTDPGRLFRTITQPTLSVSDNFELVSNINRSCIIPNNKLYCNPDGSVNSTNITCYASDTSGNTATCIYRVGVVDTQPPVLSGNCLSRGCGAHVDDRLLSVLCRC